MPRSHNLGAGGNTPPFWLPPPRGLGWRHAMFNAFLLGDGHRVSALDSLYAWVDSGAFLLLEAPQRRLAGLNRRREGDSKDGGGAPSGWSKDLVEEALRRQRGLHPRLPPASRSQVDPGCPET